MGPLAARVWVVDDDRSVASALSRMLRTAAVDVEVLHHPASLLEKLDREAPDCLLMDLWLGSTCALDLLPELERHVSYVPVVFLSGRADVASSVIAMKHGAVDFLTKPVDSGLLLEAVIRALARARAWRDAAAERTDASNRLSMLTPREQEVFAQVVLGKPNKRIAMELGTSEKTVKVHRGRVMHKLAAHSVVDLVRLDDRARGR
ncbi:MAG TPA: response regulator [Myxococcaceae bacterium]|nr:response regulator [Myxococcaceae bacterium]